MTKEADVTDEWFRRWFGEAYLALYPHRDEAEAAAGVDLFLKLAGSPGRTLDLACGGGRHLEHLHTSGVPAIGLDLSMPLLRTARERPGAADRLVRADMRRLPFADGIFEGLVNFFTSFGYFETHEEDRDVAREMRRVVRPGSPFLIDYLNSERVRRGLVPQTDGDIGGRRVRQTRWLEDDRVVKRIEILDEGTEPEVYHERVRLYDPDALVALLESEGLAVQHTFGGYTGEGFEFDSDRFLVAGRAR